MTRMVVRASIAILAAIGAVTACDSFAATEVAPDASAPDATTATDASASDGGATDADAGLSRSALYEALVKSHGPAAYWRLGEGSGTKTTSIAGQPYELVIPANGPAWTDTGLFGAESRSVRFLSSTTNAITENTGTTVKHVGPNDFALEAWIEIAATDNLDRWIIRQTGTATSYGIYLDSTGVTAQNVLAGAVEIVSANGALGPGWHHVVMSRSSKPFVLWVDATKYDAPDGADAGTMSFTPSFVIGGRTQSTNLLPADARVAEVAIYDRGLTAAEVAEHHAAGKP